MSRRGLLCALRSGERFLVDKDQFTIGRVKDCDLQLPHGSMSKRHAAIVRRAGNWYVMDLKSTSGTYLDDVRVPAPTKLAAGMRLQVGQERIRILELDHVATPGEFTDRVDRRLRLSCPQLLCRAEVSFSSITGSAALHQLVGEQLQSIGVAGSDTVALADPVELVLALQRLHQCGGFGPHRAGGIDLRIAQHDVVIGHTALELLAESTVPALSAWRWLMRSQVIVPPALLRGIALVMPFQAAPQRRAELRAAVEPGPGLCLWLEHLGNGYLVWVDRPITLGGDGDIVIRTSEDQLAIRPSPSGWIGNEQPLVAGAQLQVGHCDLEVLAVYDTNGIVVM